MPKSTRYIPLEKVHEVRIHRILHMWNYGDAFVLLANWNKTSKKEPAVLVMLRDVLRVC